MIKVIVLDFDGTVVPDSEALKQQAYYLSFSDYQEEVPHEAIDQAREKFGKGRGTRFDKLRHVFELLGESSHVVSKKVEQYSERYDQVVKKHTLKLGVPTSHRDTLERLAKKFPMYLNSIAPEKSLRMIVQELGIAPLLKDIFGAPRSKVENLKTIASNEKVEPKDILFVGDGENDFNAAHEFGCRFVGFANDWNNWKGTEKPFPVVTDLSELEQYI